MGVTTHSPLSPPLQPENVMVVKPATELPVVKLLHFSRAQEVGRAPVIVPPNLDHMEFEGTIAIPFPNKINVHSKCMCTYVHYTHFCPSSCKNSIISVTIFHYFTYSRYLSIANMKQQPPPLYVQFDVQRVYYTAYQRTVETHLQYPLLFLTSDISFPLQHLSC